MEMQTARERMEALAPYRDPYLKRGRQAASLTLPHVLPPEGHTATSDLPTPYQSLGARGVTNLAAKLTLTLFPPHNAFFKHEVDKFRAKDKGATDAAIAQAQNALAAMERASLSRMEVIGLRPEMHEAFIRTLISGGSLVYVGEEQDDSRVFSLDRYVVRRTAAGKVMEFITQDDIDVSDIPEEYRADLPSTRSDESTKGNSPTQPPQSLNLKPGSKGIEDKAGVDGDFGLYTWGRRQSDGRWLITQEVEGQEIFRDEGVKDQDLRYFPIRFNRISNESYGRGFVEQYMGDLIRLEALSKAVVEGAAAAAMVKFLVNPNGVTDIADLADAENLEFLPGLEQDVSVLNLGKYSDFRFVLEASDRIEKRLEYAFLLNTALQRTGERVTAEEIRTLAEELENALGGVYSIFSVELQARLADLLTKDLQRTDNWPELPDTVVTKVITGMEALGRAHEGNRLDTWIARAAQTLGPEAVLKRLNPSEYLRRQAASMGVDSTGILLEEEVVQTNDQQAQRMAMVQQGMKSPAAKVVAEQYAQQQQQQQQEPE